MTPFEALFLILYTATCVVYYLWTRKLSKTIRSLRMKKHKKRLKKKREHHNKEKK